MSTSIPDRSVAVPTSIVPVLRVLALVATLATAAGCEPSAAEDGSMFDGTVHPTPENIPEEADLAGVIGMTRGEPGTGELGRVARALRSLEEVAGIGAFEGDKYSMFGLVEDIEVDEEGTVLVLDSRFNDIRSYDRTGAFVRAFGGPGRGPEEFEAPEAMERDPHGWLFVADRANQIKAFEPVGGSHVHRTTIRTEFVPEDFCLLDGRIYVQGARLDGGTVHVFSTSGEHVRSFGEPYRSDNPLVRMQLSDGPIACSEEAKTVLVMYKYLSIISAYTPEGELRWRSRLADFRPMEITELIGVRGRPAVRFSGDEYDFVEAMLAIPGGSVILQVSRRDEVSRAAEREYAALHTYLISAESGEGIYVGDHLPRIHAFRAPHLFTGERDPYPRVRIHRLAAGGV